MIFTKMQACGNDYVCIELFTQQLSDIPEFAKKISEQHYGVGSDGLVLVCPSEKADFRMRIFNKDGSEGEMCGNGLRMASKLFYDRISKSKTELCVETLSGIKEVTLFTENGCVTDVAAQIGRACFDVNAIPCLLHGENGECITRSLEVSDGCFNVSAVSVGNPHCCIVCDDPEKVDLEKYGKAIENHKMFPSRTNVEFFTPLSKDEIYMRTWERGCGETLGCATGSAACVAVAIRLGLVSKRVLVRQRGGNVTVFADKDGNLHIQGRPFTVFEGSIKED